MIDALVHVTHEAVQKVGGIGTVLQGLVTAPAYTASVRRTIFLGPLNPGDESRIEAGGGRVLYSSRLAASREGTDALFDPVVQKYNVDILYGVRRVSPPEDGGETGEVDVVLVDPGHLNPRHSQNFKYNLYETFGIQSDRYESSAEYELYLGIAEAGLDAVHVLLQNLGGACLLAHEFMGMPAALKAVMSYPQMATVFYAHEVATARNLVENSAGHDLMFYNVMAQALRDGLTVDDVFGDQSGFFRHALVRRAHHCNGIFAVGDPVVDELKFLGESFRESEIDLVYNGIPDLGLPFSERMASRARLADYGETLTGARPDIVFTHVARPVISKAIWRDLRVLESLDELLAEAGRRGIFYLLSTVGGPRPQDEVLQMEARYGWPVEHRRGWPDLVGPEAALWTEIAAFNRRSKSVKAIFCNTFGWDRVSCGLRMPESMEMMDLRKGTDVEFGQSIYEPFGISQLEPLGAGAVCVLSEVCGCVGFLRKAASGGIPANVVIADYASRSDVVPLASLRATDNTEWDRNDRERSRLVARGLWERLPNDDDSRMRMLEDGSRLAGRMSWRRVCEDQFLPGVRRAIDRLS